MGTGHRSRLYAALGAVYLSVLSGCYLFPREEKMLEPPLIETPEVTYDVMRVERGTIEKKIIGSGTFVSVDQVNHYFRYRGGRLKVYHTGIGEEVAKGDLLAELHTDKVENDIEQQRLLLRKTEIQYQKLKMAAQDDSPLKLADLQIRLGRARQEDLERQLEQAQLLADIENTSAADDRVARLTSDLEYQRLALEQAQIDYERLQENREAEWALDLAQLDVDLARLELEDLQREMEQAKLRAVLDGTVVYLNYRLREGDEVDAYQTLISVADPHRLQFQYSGYNSSEFQLGMTVEVEIEHQIYTGRVVMTPINLPVDADDSLRDKIRIAVGNLPAEVTIGDSASLRLTLARKENTIVLPRRVVRNYLGRRFVQILEDDIKKERDVMIGIETPTELEILKGLETGDQVILR